MIQTFGVFAFTAGLRREKEIVVPATGYPFSEVKWHSPLTPLTSLDTAITAANASCAGIGRASFGLSFDRGQVIFNSLINILSYGSKRISTQNQRGVIVTSRIATELCWINRPTPPLDSN